MIMGQNPMIMGQCPIYLGQRPIISGQRPNILGQTVIFIPEQNIEVEKWVINLYQPKVQVIGGPEKLKKEINDK